MILLYKKHLSVQNCLMQWNLFRHFLRPAYCPAFSVVPMFCFIRGLSIRSCTNRLSNLLALWCLYRITA